MTNNYQSNNNSYIVSTDRIIKLRDKVLNSPMEVSIIRAREFTAAKQRYSEEPLTIQRAMAFADSLNATPALILDDELIVGRITEKIRGAAVYPEVRAEWLLNELKVMDRRFTHRFSITEKDSEELIEIAKKWKDVTALDLMLKSLEPEVKEIRNRFIATDTAFSYGLHLFYPDMRKFLTLGIDAIIDQIRIQHSKEDSNEKKDFYDGVVITLEATQNWILKYAEEAEKQAVKSNGTRSEELKSIAVTLKNIVHKPVATFYEGLQLIYMLHLLLDFADGGHEIPYGRVDQLLYELYSKDIKNGKITESAARELIEAFYIQASSISHFFETMVALGVDGNTGRLNITLGGTDEQGNDATNDLSYLFLNAANDLKTPQPNVSVRIHKSSPDKFVKLAVSVMAGGSNMIAVYNDEAIVPTLLERQVSINDAREYAVGGCVSFLPRGTYGPFCGSHVFLPKVLERVLLNDQEYNTYKEFELSLRNELSTVIKRLSYMLDKADLAHMELLPQPFVSAMVEGAVEKGTDVKANGGKYNFTGMNFVGFANLVDSVAVIKHLVFEKGEISFKELVEAIKANYEGYQKVQQIILNKIPKFGSDDERTNLIAKELWDFLDAEASKYRTFRGGWFIPGLINSSTLYMIVGAVSGATPDGRTAKAPVSLGVAPVNGAAVNGPTGIFNSIGSLDIKKAAAGFGLNMRFHPSAFKTDSQIQRFENLLKTYFFELGGQHLQITVADAKILKEAKAEPQKYSDLMVRVAGYSARFVELSPMTQDEIISRTEHMAV